MTWDERVAKVRLHGFTDRQFLFLVTVMLHAGVCPGRQYCTFAGLAYGRITSLTVATIEMQTREI